MDEYRNSKDKTESEFYSYTTANQSNMEAISDAKLDTGKLDQVKYVCVQPMEDQLKSGRGRNSFWQPEHWFRIKTFTIAGQTFAKFTPRENTVSSTDTDKPVMQYKIKIADNAFDILEIHYRQPSDIGLSVDRPDSDGAIDEAYTKYLNSITNYNQAHERLTGSGNAKIPDGERRRLEAKRTDAQTTKDKKKEYLAGYKRPPYLYLKKLGST